MAQKRRFSTEYNREAVLGRCRREFRQESAQAFGGNGRPRGENLALRRQVFARVMKERDFLQEATAFFARTSDEVSDDPMMPAPRFSSG